MTQLQARVKKYRKLEGRWQLQSVEVVALDEVVPVMEIRSSVSITQLRAAKCRIEFEHKFEIEVVGGDDEES